MEPSALVLGLECGGSDALCGITANPALGVASDLLVAAGGTSILAESPELIGAEQILAARAVSPEVAQGVLDTILGFERADPRARHRRPRRAAVARQPGRRPDDDRGEVAGRRQEGRRRARDRRPRLRRAAARRRACTSWTRPVTTSSRWSAWSPGGAQLVAFTTGRGTPTGSAIAPCLKISTNTSAYRAPGGRRRHRRRRDPGRPRERRVDGPAHLRRPARDGRRRADLERAAAASATSRSAAPASAPEVQLHVRGALRGSP